MKIFLWNLVDRDWITLGLHLGLHYSTLTKIRTDRHSNLEECKMVMLAAWLQQQDNVPQTGVPSWSVLRAALRSMRKDELADKIIIGELS